MSDVPSEVEAKLLVPAGGDLRPLAQLERLGRYAVRPRDVARLHSVYLDTADLALARQGIALRVRRQAGSWEATAKWAGTVRGDVHDRPELTVPLARAPRFPFTPPPGPLAMHLAALIAGRPVVPILITDITRRRADILRLPAGPRAEAVAELALDRVHLRGPASAAAAAVYSEVEIELRQGSRRDVTSIARLFRQQFGLLPSTQSKFARGVALLYRGKIPTPRATAVVADDTLESAARKTIGAHLRRLRLYDPEVRRGHEAEALHDMRVACRRLRAAVNAFESGIPKRLHKYLKDELEWLGQLLGGVRDFDVQLELLERYCAATPSDPGGGLAGLRTYMEGERAQRRGRMLEGLNSPRYFRLLVRMEDFTRVRTRSRNRTGASKDSVAAVGRKAIKKAFRRLLKRGRAIGPAPTDEDLHALRIRAKRIRYLLEFLREVVGKPGRRLVKDLVRLQDLLGNHHDAVVAAEFIRRYVEGPGAQASAESFLSLGAFMGEERRLADAARGDFETAWARFARKRTVKDLDAVLRHLLPKTPAPPSPEPPSVETSAPTTS
jgi:inorganic triphosphatase YgiF